MVDILNEHWSDLEATETHLTLAYSRTGFCDVNIEPEFWMTGIPTISDEAIEMLSVKTDNTNTLQPGIYPGLYQYVPQDCHFSMIPADHANETLETKTTKSSSPFGSFKVQELAVSADCHLVVVTGEGVMG